MITREEREKQVVPVITREEIEEIKRRHRDGPDAEWRARMEALPPLTDEEKEEFYNGVIEQRETERRIYRDVARRLRQEKGLPVEPED